MSASTPAIEARPGEPALKVKHKALLTLAVMGASMIQILDATIANVALPHMQASLGATFDSVTWVLTSYIIAGAVTMPAIGWLSDRVGSRRLFLWAVIGFVIASMLCGLATSLPEMVAFRIFQGVCAAIIGPMSQTILLDINPPERGPQAMALWGMGIMIAPIFGPMIGGWLTESYNWRWVFYINLPIGIPTIVLLWWLLPSRPIVRRRLDMFGFGMLALGIATLQLMLDRGQHEDWLQSWEVRIELMIAVAALWMAAVHMFFSRTPLFDRALISNRNFAVALVFSVVVGLMMFGIFALLPPMLQNLYGYTVFDAGLLLAPRGLGILLAMAFASRAASVIDPRVLMGTGFSLVVVSMWMMTGWAIDMESGPILIAGLVQGFGMGMTFFPMNAMAFATLSPALRTDGSSLLYLFRSLGGSIGISVTTTMLARNIQTSHADLSGHVTSSSMAAIDPATADRWGPLGDTAMSLLDLEINRQAAMIAYLSDFKLVMILVMAFLPLLLLMKKPSVLPSQRFVAQE